MAFHLHLINALLDYVPVAAPQPRQAPPMPPAKPRLSLCWERGDDGRLQSHWTRG